MAIQFDDATECPSGYTLDDENEHEHRDADHEHEQEPKSIGGYDAAKRPFFCLLSEYEIARQPLDFRMKDYTMKAVIVAFDRFTDVDVFLPWDLLNRVRFRDKEFSVRIVGPSKIHKSVCGLELPMHGGVEECNDADLVFFASGPGTRDLIKDEHFLKQLRLDPDSQIICSMCSGALILAALGILEGVSATTYPTAVEELRGFGVEVETTKHLVTHGNIGTAAGCLAAVDLMGWAIEKLYDPEIRKDVIASVLPVGQGQACIY